MRFSLHKRLLYTDWIELCIYPYTLFFFVRTSTVNFGWRLNVFNFIEISASNCSEYVLIAKQKHERVSASCLQRSSFGWSNRLRSRISWERGSPIQWIQNKFAIGATWSRDLIKKIAINCAGNEASMKISICALSSQRYAIWYLNRMSWLYVLNLKVNLH